MTDAYGGLLERGRQHFAGGLGTAAAAAYDLYAGKSPSTAAVVHVGAEELASDPNVVAAFIRYDLDHPKHRELPTTRQTAIQRFRDAPTASPTP